MASAMLSIRLPAEDRELLKRLAVAHTRRAGGLKATTVTDIIRWGIRLVAKELAVEVGPSIEPTPNGALEVTQAVQEPAHEHTPEEPDPVAAIVEAATTAPALAQEETTLTAPVEKPPEESKAPIPDELEEMLKGV